MWMGCWNIRREISQTPATLQKCVMCYYCRITLHWSGRNEADMIRLWCIEQGVSCGWWRAGHVITILASDWLLCMEQDMLAAVLHTCCVLQTGAGGLCPA